jgi:hypothetical protein
VIAAHVVLIGVVAVGRREVVVVRQVLASRNIRSGVEADELRNHRIPPVGWDYVTWKLLADCIGSRTAERQRIVNIAPDRRLFRKVASLDNVTARNTGDKALSKPYPRSLIAEEEERSILQHGAADRTAKLVLLVIGFLSA